MLRELVFFRGVDHLGAALKFESKQGVARKVGFEPPSPPPFFFSPYRTSVRVGSALRCNRSVGLFVRRVRTTACVYSSCNSAAQAINAASRCLT